MTQELAVPQESLPELKVKPLASFEIVPINLDVAEGAFDNNLPIKTPADEASGQPAVRYPQPEGTKTLAVIEAGTDSFFLITNSDFYGTDPEVRIVSADFFKPHEDEESKGSIRVTQEEPVRIGRSHHKDVFSYSDEVSREHFMVFFDDNGGLRVQNQNPTNGTNIILPEVPKEVDRAADTLEVANADITLPGTDQAIDDEKFEEMRLNHKMEGARVESGEDLEGRKVVTLTKAGEYGNPDRKNEDYVLANLDHGVYGVFDGVGGSHGETAGMGSKAAGDAISKILEVTALSGSPEKQLKALEDAIKLADIDVSTQGASTTAAVAKLIKDPEANGSKMVWASVGDSRIYVMNPAGEVRQVTEDEGYRHIITNAMGVFVDEEGKRFPAFTGVHNKGIEEVEDGSTVLIVTDGITGDYEEQQLSLDDIKNALNKGEGDPSEMARQLLGASIKIDDKSIVVIQT